MNTKKRKIINPEVNEINHSTLAYTRKTTNNKRAKDSNDDDPYQREDSYVQPNYFVPFMAPPSYRRNFHESSSKNCFIMIYLEIKNVQSFDDSSVEISTKRAIKKKIRSQLKPKKKQQQQINERSDSDDDE